ncbi:MAG: hypothetical protein ABI562_05970 [Chloroflexota bacterium]
MGPMLMTGLAVFGATIALGLIASNTPRSTGPTRDPASPRGLAIILMAIALGIAVLGVVVGLLAIFRGETSDPSSGLLATGPAVAGAILGLGLIVRRVGNTDPTATAYGVANIIGQGVLGAVVAVLAVLVVEEGTGKPADWPFVILGLASAAAALGIGLTGARSLQALAGADESTAKAIRARQISRCLLFQAVGVGASVVAILLVELA